MKTEFKDVWHLYLGCPVVEVKYPEEGSAPLTIDVVNAFSEEDDKDQHWTKHLKPILRPLSDMTQEETMYLCPAALEGRATIYMNAELTAFYLKQGFDLFGLIESGQAIDKTTIEQHQRK